MEAAKHTMKLITHGMCIATRALANVAREGRPAHINSALWAGHRFRLEMHQTLWPSSAYEQFTTRLKADNSLIEALGLQVTLWPRPDHRKESAIFNSLEAMHKLQNGLLAAGRCNKLEIACQ